MEALEQIQSYIDQRLGNDIIIKADEYGVLNTEVAVNQVYKLMHNLFHDETWSFNFLTDLCGIHYPENKGKELGVVYHVHSMKHNLRLRIKTFVAIEKPEVPTMTSLYGSANWMERETYDFYGIHFLGHPDLRRILNMDEMEAFPLRKEYPLEDPLREDKADFQFGR